MSDAKKIILGSALLMGSIVLADAASWADPPTEKNSPEPPRSFKPIMTVEQLMGGQDKLYSEIKDGILDGAWTEAETSAWLLAELANVNHYQSDKPDYKRFADAMAVECQTLAKVLRKRNAAEAKAQTAKVGDCCKACHDVHKK